jgi:hypothetical protein
MDCPGIQPGYSLLGTPFSLPPREFDHNVRLTPDFDHPVPKILSIKGDKKGHTAAKYS